MSSCQSPNPVSMLSVAELSARSLATSPVNSNHSNPWRADAARPPQRGRLMARQPRQRARRSPAWRGSRDVGRAGCAAQVGTRQGAAVIPGRAGRIGRSVSSSSVTPSIWPEARCCTKRRAAGAAGQQIECLLHSLPRPAGSVPTRAVAAARWRSAHRRRRRSIGLVRAALAEEVPMSMPRYIARRRQPAPRSGPSAARASTVDDEGRSTVRPTTAAGSPSCWGRPTPCGGVSRSISMGAAMTRL